MNQYDQQQKFLPRKLLDCDESSQTRSIHSDKSLERMAAFSAPPILFDIGTRFYEDFIEEITQSDPQLDRFGIVKSFAKRAEDKTQVPSNGYRKFSLQNEEYHSYYAVHVPAQQYYSSLTPEEQILNNLDQAAKWARDQYGSRAVQSVISTGQSYAKNAVFESLIQESIELTKDKFGNYVFQKLFENGEEAHKERLFHVIKEHILEFSQNCYGCRVVQKAIEFTKGRLHLQKELIGLIEPYSVYLIQNINGNHVMQKLFEIVELPFLMNCIKLLSDNYKKLSLHAYGCRVIQKYLEKLHTEIAYREDQIRSENNASRLTTLHEELAAIKELEKTMFEKLLAISVELSQCQYGNYVMQHIVSNSKEYKPLVEQLFLSNFILLSSNKYASNVIEKVIKLSSADYRERLAKCLCESQSFVGLAKHQYGNYVIQSLIQKISSQSRQAMKNKLKQNSQQLNKSQYGRHVLLQLQKLK